MTLVAMVLGLMAVLLFGGYIRDINYSLQTNFVTITGHLQVQHKDYFRRKWSESRAINALLYGISMTSVSKNPDPATRRS